MIDDFLIGELFGGPTTFNGRFGAPQGPNPLMPPAPTPMQLGGGTAPMPNPLMPRPAPARTPRPDLLPILSGVKLPMMPAEPRTLRLDIDSILGGGTDPDWLIRSRGTQMLKDAFARRAGHDADLGGQPLLMRDRVQATRDAAARGEYAPNGSGGMNYKGSIRPNEDIDPVLRGDVTEFSDARRKKGGSTFAIPGDAGDGPTLEGDKPESLFGKRLQATLAGGMSDADARFRGGAFMKGFSGGLKGGLASDKADADARTAAEKLAVEQESKAADLDIRNRQVSNAEQTGEAQRRLMGIQEDEIRSGRSTGRDKARPADVATAEWLVEKGIAPDPQTAWNMVRRSRSNPEQIAAQIIGRGISPEHGRRNLEEYYKMFPHLRPAQPITTPASAAPRAEVPSTSRVVGDREAEERGLYERPARPSKPLNLKLPSRPQGVPPNAGYSPGSRMWFTRDGQAFDESGQPVSR